MKEKLILFANKAKFNLKKHSPEILVAAGLVGTVVGTVLACKATTKVKDIVDEHKDNLDKLNKQEDLTDEEYKKNLTLTYAKTGIKITQLYLPAAGVMALSFTSIVSGHKILSKRNVALAAAYTAIDTGFKKYRENVVERFGEEVDKELKYSIKNTEKQIEEKPDSKDNEVLDPNGKSSLPECSVYAKFFDAASCEFQKDPEYNLMFLRRQQDWANEKLKSQGYLFLNDVYDMLDIPKTKAGQIVGWIYDPKNGKGDNYIDFGIYRDNEATNRFVNGIEQNVLLDFNVDGPIYNLFSQE